MYKYEEIEDLNFENSRIFEECHFEPVKTLISCQISRKLKITVNIDYSRDNGDKGNLSLVKQELSDDYRFTVVPQLYCTDIMICTVSHTFMCNTRWIYVLMRQE